MIKIKEVLFEENNRLKKELKLKDEEFEKITKNYNLLYSQYHLLLNKKKSNYVPCSNIISYQKTC